MSFIDSRTAHPQSIWDEEAVLDAFTKYGIKHEHHDKFMRAIYEQFSTGAITSLAQYKNPEHTMTPKLEHLCHSGDFALMTTKVIRREDSSDQSTTKLLIELPSGDYIETVLMRYSNSSTQEHTRTTICLSSQIGCGQGCTFCATGKLGLSGSLTVGQIIEQFVWAHSRIEDIRNVVFMGQGEPMAHSVYNNVLNAVKILTSSSRFSLKQQRVTISTVGVVDNMYRVIDTMPGVTIALSLHAPTQTMRQRIVPSARKYALKELIEVVDYYHDKTKKKMLIEYVLLDDVNCDPETAHLLGKLLTGRGVLLNLIPFNPVLTKANHRAPSPERIIAFAEIVSTYGVLTTTRKECGQDINGACGQLSSSRRNKPKGYTITDDFPETKEQNENEKPSQSSTNDDNQGEEVEIPAYKPNENNKTEDDVIEDGLEGLVSAMGWMDKPQALPQSGVTTTQDDSHIGVTRHDLIDNTGCSSDVNGGDNSLQDVEDLLTSTSTTTTTPNNTLSIKQQAERERDIRHDAATATIDPLDRMKWSLAVIGLGPCYKQEQMTYFKKGETKKARVQRLLHLQAASNDGSVMGDDDHAADQVVCGDEPDDIDSKLRSVVSPSVDLSRMTGLTTSTMRSAAPVSSLRLKPREKDLQPRVFMPKKTNSAAVMDLDQAGWDAIPETVKEEDDEEEEDIVSARGPVAKATTTTAVVEEKTTLASTTPSVVDKPLEQTTTPTEDIPGFEELTPQEQHKLMYLSALIVVLLVILIARRLS